VRYSGTEWQRRLVPPCTTRACTTESRRKHTSQSLPHSVKAQCSAQHFDPFRPIAAIVRFGVKARPYPLPLSHRPWPFERLDSRWIDPFAKQALHCALCSAGSPRRSNGPSSAK
jgi:hypothetical protein